MMRAATSIFLMLVMFLAACSYSSSEIYYASPVPGDTATVVLSTNLDNIDTVVISDSLLFKYRAEIENGELYFTSASVGPVTLYQHATDYDPDTLMGPFVLRDSFWIWSDPATDTGLYSLLFTVYYSSNTNSLGDELGIEADILKLEFDLLVEGGEK